MLNCLQVFKDAEVLSQELQENEDKPVEFYVYNSETDEVRVVVLLPTLNWGGEGKTHAISTYGTRRYFL